MSVDERARHQLFVKLEEVIGPDSATTLMEHLPPGGYTELATKQDLAALEDRLRAMVSPRDAHTGLRARWRRRQH